MIGSGGGAGAIAVGAVVSGLGGMVLCAKAVVVWDDGSGMR